MRKPEQVIDQASHETRLSAIAVSRGIGIGRVFFLHGDKSQFFRIELEAGQIESEIARLSKAVGAATKELRELAAGEGTTPAHPVAAILDVHLLILTESSFVAKIEAAIGDQSINAEWALKTVADDYRKLQQAVTDVRFREKHLDIDDVAERVLRGLIGSPSTLQTGFSNAVIVARELRPSAILELARSGLVALITERGGWTSHASILAREFRLPMVSGIKHPARVLSDRDLVIVDGTNGVVIIDPDDETLARYRALDREEPPVEIGPDRDNRAVTLDGTEIVIRANVDVPEAYRSARELGACGIGLFRSESLIRRPGEIPTEDQQVEAYSRMADIAGDAGVKIRTFDVAIEQFLDDGNTTERNPSLGLRSIRLSLTNSEAFRTQIRAILRASVGRNIDIVLPMVSGVKEVLLSRAMIDEERTALSARGIAVGMPGLGVMIEVPSAVLTAHEIAAETDFLCLGTNDLVQYLLAVDRDNDLVAEWYQTLHPAVIRAIRMVLEAAHDADIPLTVCGEMAGSAFYVPVLIGLGVRDLSMNSKSIRHIRRLISGIAADAARDLVASTQMLKTAESIETALREHYIEHWHGLFPQGILSSRHH